MRRRTVTGDDGVRLVVREFGETHNPTLICLHGYPDNQNLWEGTVTRLSERFHVVTYDVRGAGESDKPGSRHAYRLRHLEADLDAVAGAVQPHAPVHLLGHDWGSVQAWHAVTGDRMDGRIASFTAISGPCLDHVAHWFRDIARNPTPRALLRAVRQLTMSVYTGLFQVPRLPELAWRTGLMSVVIGAVDRLDPGTAEAGGHRPLVDDGVRGLALYRANMFTRLRQPGRRSTRIPVQVLAPTRDPFVSRGLQESAREWVRQLRVRPVPGGHWLPISSPDVVARRVTEWIEHTDGGPTHEAR